MARYRGRFAPSPTGLLHRGSLVAAVASWLDARAHDGAWLIRIEDLDRPRCMAGADEAMLATLARFGLTSDEPVLYQSTREAAYHEALAVLVDAGLAYRCRCSRSEAPGPYPGHCRDLGIQDPGTAWRLRLDRIGSLKFDDRIQGPQTPQAAVLGDPVLIRRDGIAAYQLAVVVDDHFQGITDVVRGADLLESTGWQVGILRGLGLATPRYAHVPVVTEPGGAKLAKSQRSLPLAGLDAGRSLDQALKLLGMTLNEQLKAAPVSEMLHWAVQNWRPDQLAGRLAVSLPD